jgi:hypothetical protein
MAVMTAHGTDAPEDMIVPWLIAGLPFVAITPFKRQSIS